MRSAMKIIILGLVLLLGSISVASAEICRSGSWEIESMSGFCGGIVVNQYGAFGYDFVPEYDGKFHWYDLSPNCTWAGIERREWMHEDLRRYLELTTKHLSVERTLDGLACEGAPFSVKDRDLIMAHVSQKRAEYLVSYANDIKELGRKMNTDFSESIASLLKQAEDYFRIAERLESQYFGAPGGL